MITQEPASLPYGKVVGRAPIWAWPKSFVKKLWASSKFTLLSLTISPALTAISIRFTSGIESGPLINVLPYFGLLAASCAAYRSLEGSKLGIRIAVAAAVLAASMAVSYYMIWSTACRLAEGCY
jgi:hypothetical protein